MPIISTNDEKLHKELKVYVAKHEGWTIGKAVERFVELGLRLKLLEISEHQIESIENLNKEIKSE